MCKFKTPKNKKNIRKICIKYELHILNLWTIIMQSLNVKEWILLEFQFTLARHPLSISEGKHVYVNTLQKLKKKLNVHKIEGANLQCVNNHDAKFEY